MLKKVKDLTVEELINLGKQDNVRNLEITIDGSNHTNKHFDVKIGGVGYGRTLFLEDEIEVSNTENTEHKRLDSLSYVLTYRVHYEYGKVAFVDKNDVAIQTTDVDKWHETIEQALQELYAIKNSKPSEAMKCLEKKIMWTYDLNIIRQTLLKAQEQEKVLDIIINKNVSVWGFRNRVFGYQKEQNGNKIINDTYEYYLNNFGCYHNGFDIELLTKEEFNTLKEYFKC